MDSGSPPHRMLQRIFICLIGIAALVLCLSYTAEHLFDMKTCKLCRFQRAAYFLLIPISLAGLYTRYKMIVIRALQAFLVLGFFIACYHSAIVLGITEDFCLSKPTVGSIESFKAAIEKTVPCSESTWKIFNIPASVCSALLSISLATAIQIITRKKKKKHILSEIFSD